MEVRPYLNFNGRCEEALEFYKTALGAEIGMLLRYDESPEPTALNGVAPGSGSKVMHATFRVGETELQATDGDCQGATRFEGISLSIRVADAAEAKRYYDSLAEGGNVAVSLMTTFFSSAFGIVVDRFGVTWMFVAPA